MLPFALFALRTAVNETTGVEPCLLTFGRRMRTPLQILKDNWIDRKPLPLDIAKSTSEYLRELETNLEISCEFANEHAELAQQRYSDRYNLRSRVKSFVPGDLVIYLAPSTTNKAFAQWQGPFPVVEVKSKYSYVIDIDGKRKHVHADHIRKFHSRVNDTVQCNCAIIFESDREFGEVPTIDAVAMCNSESVETSSSDVSIHPLLPSNQVLPEQVSHLTDTQRKELFELLDMFPECFKEHPGFCPYVEHCINVTPDFKPKRLREYRIPELLKSNVQSQIDELLRLKFISPSTSPMASPVVCVLKGRDKKGGVRLAVDFRYLNSQSQNDAYVLPHLGDLIQKVGKSRYISSFDCRSGYWQLGIREADRYLTSFADDGGQYEWNRMPFGLRTAGNTFVRCIQIIIQPIRDFCYSFIDDMSVCSDSWDQHLDHLKRYLTVIREAGLVLHMKKTSFAMSEVKFVGHIIGSGKHRPDPDKLSAVAGMSRPETKRDVRRIIGFFSYFRSYLPHFAHTSNVLTDLTQKEKPTKVVWTEVEEKAFQELKRQLCEECTRIQMYTVDYGKPFGLLVDVSGFAVGSCLIQWDEEGKERPIAFASAKLAGA